MRTLQEIDFTNINDAYLDMVQFIKLIDINTSIMKEKFNSNNNIAIDPWFINVFNKLSKCIDEIELEKPLDETIEIIKKSVDKLKKEDEEAKKKSQEYKIQRENLMKESHERMEVGNRRTKILIDNCMYRINSNLYNAKTHDEYNKMLIEELGISESDLPKSYTNDDLDTIFMGKLKIKMLRRDLGLEEINISDDRIIEIGKKIDCRENKIGHLELRTCFKILIIDDSEELMINNFMKSIKFESKSDEDNYNQFLIKMKKLIVLVGKIFGYGIDDDILDKDIENTLFKIFNGYNIFVSMHTEPLNPYIVYRDNYAKFIDELQEHFGLEDEYFEPYYGTDFSFLDGFNETVKNVIMRQIQLDSKKYASYGSVFGSVNSIDDFITIYEFYVNPPAPIKIMNIHNELNDTIDNTFE